MGGRRLFEEWRVWGCDGPMVYLRGKTHVSSWKRTKGGKGGKVVYIHEKPKGMRDDNDGNE